MSSRSFTHRVGRIASILAVGVILPTMGVAQQPGGPMLYQFQPGQLMRFDVTFVEDGTTTEGYYQIAVAAAGGGQVQVSIEAQVGDNSCNTSSSVAPGAGVAGQMMMTCFTLIPVASALFAPTWAMVMGQNFTVGNSWSMGNVSFAVTENCTYAGVTGVRMVMEEDGEEKINSCYSNALPLPLYVLFNMDDDSSVELEATEVNTG